MLGNSKTLGTVTQMQNDEMLSEPQGASFEVALFILARCASKGFPGVLAFTDDLESKFRTSLACASGSYFPEPNQNIELENATSKDASWLSSQGYFRAKRRLAPCRSLFARQCLLLMFVITVAGCSNDQSEYEALRKKDQIRKANAGGLEQDLGRQLKSIEQELTHGSAHRAFEMSRSLLLQNPENENVLVVTAEAQAANGDVIGAAKILQTIPTDNIDRKALRFLKASDWLVNAGHYEIAISTLMSFVDKHPKQTRVRRRLAKLLNQSGLRLAASKHLYFLLKTSKLSEEELFALVSLRKALIDSSLPAPRSKSDSPVLLSRAMSLHDDGHSIDALNLVEGLSKKHPENGSLSAFAARLLAVLNFDDRLQDWISSAQVDLTDQPDYWFALGLRQYRKEQYEEATRCFGECLLLDHTDRDAAIHFARALNYVGKTLAAEQALSRYQKMERIATLASSFGQAKGTAEDYFEMAELLDAIGRAWEADGWRAIALQTKNAGGTDQAGRIRSSDEPVFRPELSVCSLDIRAFPMPEISKPGNNPTRDSPQPMPADTDADIRLVNIANDLGINFTYQNGDDPSDDNFFLHQQTGGGIGVVDFDLDGWPDLYFVQAGGDAFAQDSQSDQLYRNLEGTKFRQVNQGAKIENLGYGQGVDVSDLNQDGFPDILVANIGSNIIWINNGDGTFSKQEVEEQVGSWTTSIASGDLDGDHLPEIIEVNYIDDPAAFATPCVSGNDECGPSRFRPAKDRWLSVNQEGKIEPWKSKPDQNGRAGHGFGAFITNIDNDNMNDVYVANDADANCFWKSVSAKRRDLKTSPLLEFGQLAGCAAGDRGGNHGSMGLAASDWDRNGLLDLHVTNYWDQSADFYLQVRSGVFHHATRKWRFAEETKPTVGWGTQAIDLNQDGWDDAITLNGHIVDRSQDGTPYKMLPQVFVHTGTDWKETTQNVAETESYWGKPALGRSLCRIDFDRDGRCDLIAGHLDQPIAALRNETPKRNWVRFSLVGVQSERDAIGARVRVNCGRTLVGWQIGGGGFLCDNEPVIDFGLGDCETISRVEVIWPSGQTQSFNEIKARHHYQLVEGQSLVQIDRPVVSSLQ